MHPPGQHSGEPNAQLAPAFDGILREFGTSVSQLTIIIAVIIGSLGFEKTFNAATWSLSAIGCLAMLHLFKRQIRADVGRTAADAMAIFALLAASYLVLKNTWPGFAAAVADPKVLSAYWAATFTLPIGLLISSYKKQENAYGLPYPESIERSIQLQLLRSRFYASKIRYDVEFGEVTERGVLVTMRYAVTTINRTTEPQGLNFSFPVGTRSVRSIALAIDGKQIDVRESRYLTSNGLQFSWNIPPGKSLLIVVDASVEYRHEDSELFTTYLPATDLNFVLKNPGDHIDLAFDFLYDQTTTNLSVTPKADSKFVTLDAGLLPFEGVKLNWRLNGKEKAA